MNKNVLDLPLNQLNNLLNEVRTGKDNISFKELASKYKVDYGSLMYYLQRNKNTIKPSLKQTGENNKPEVKKEEMKKPVVDDTTRFNIVKYTIMGISSEKICKKYNISIKEYINQINNYCVPVNYETIRNSINIKNTDGLRLNTIAYIIANPKMKRAEFRKSKVFTYNEIIMSLYFLFDLGVLHKNDYIPLKIVNHFVSKFDSRQQREFIECVHDGMKNEELSTLFELEIYEIETILKSEKFKDAYSDYIKKINNKKKDIVDKIQPSTQESNNDTNKENNSIEASDAYNTIQRLEKEIKIKQLELLELKLSYSINEINNNIKTLQDKLESVQKEYDLVKEQIKSLK